MAHKEQVNYVNKIKNKFPHYFTNQKVLGIGTFNVCGTEDQYFDNYQILDWDMGGESEQTSGLEEFNPIKHQDLIIYSRLINQ